MNQEFIRALEEIESEKGIPREIIFDALEKALTTTERMFQLKLTATQGKLKCLLLKKL